MNRKSIDSKLFNQIYVISFDEYKSSYTKTQYADIKIIRTKKDIKKVVKICTTSLLLFYFIEDTSKLTF